MLLNYILIDPIPIQRLHLLQYVNKNKFLKLMGEFSNAVDAHNFLNYNTVDLIFLSSKMPVYSGFDFIDKLCDPHEIILLTDRPEDAIIAYEYGLTDCIAPPFSEERIEKAIERTRKNITSSQRNNKNKGHVIEIKHNFKTEKISTDSIRWVEAMGDYVRVISNDKKYMVLSTMKAFMTKLPENEFLRIHKSFIINLKKVVNYSANKVNVDGTELPVSRSKKKDFREIIRQA